MPSIRMQAPASVVVGSKVLFPDGSSGDVTIGGRIQVPPLPVAIAGLLAAGFTFTPDNSIPWVSGRWYGGAETFAAVISVTGKIYGTPIYVPTRVNVSALGLNVTTQQAASAARMGMYSDNYGKPDALLFVTSTAETATTGAGAADGALTEPYALDPGWYWRVCTFTSAGTFPSVSGVTSVMANQIARLLGATTSALGLAVTAAGAASGVIADFTYGALPAAFPSTNYGLVVNAAIPTFAIKAA